MALCCCMETKRRDPKASGYLSEGSCEALEPCPLKSCVSMPQMTTGALAVCCHLLSALRCTDATCPLIGLLTKLRVMAVRDGQPTWHCGWEVAALVQQSQSTGKGKLVERWVTRGMSCSFGKPLCFGGAPWLRVLARRTLLRGAAALG